MARLEYVDTENLSARGRELLEQNGHKNIFRMLAHSESHFRNYCRLGHAIRHRGELDPKLRELAITLTGMLCESEYEVIAHKRIAADVGVPAEQLAALETWRDAPVFTSLERAVLQFTDQIVTTHRPDEAAFAAVQSALTPGALIELHLAVGYYVMTSKFLRGFDIDLQ
ncbi:MAG: carboxymuconolactone decarboxylase family protein [Pseudomonadota bacterium]